VDDQVDEKKQKGCGGCLQAVTFLCCAFVAVATLDPFGLFHPKVDHARYVPDDSVVIPHRDLEYLENTSADAVHLSRLVEDVRAAVARDDLVTAHELLQACATLDSTTFIAIDPAAIETATRGAVTVGTATQGAITIGAVATSSTYICFAVGPSMQFKLSDGSELYSDGSMRVDSLYTSYTGFAGPLTRDGRVYRYTGKGWAVRPEGIDDRAANFGQGTDPAERGRLLNALLIRDSAAWFQLTDPQRADVRRWLNEGAHDAVAYIWSGDHR
jgi:hypothetical protein